MIASRWGRWNSVSSQGTKSCLGLDLAWCSARVFPATGCVLSNIKWIISGGLKMRKKWRFENAREILWDASALNSRIEVQKSTATLGPLS